MGKTLYKISLLMFLTSPIAVLSQNASHKDALKKNIVLFESARNSSDFMKAGNGFESIALKEKKDWLAYYYAGLCNTLAAFEKPKTEIDPICDKADVLAKKADSLSPANSEVFVLKSMIAAARIKVNPTQRGKKYGSQATKWAVEAIKLNDANPRAHFVKAQATLNTPTAFGGGEKKAKPLFELVLEKCKTFKPESALHPKWGKEEAEKEIQKINNSKK